MTWHKRIEIQCDGDGCSMFIQKNSNSVLKAERKAENHGWEEVEGSHYCPRCKDED